MQLLYERYSSTLSSSPAFKAFNPYWIKQYVPRMFLFGFSDNSLPSFPQNNHNLPPFHTPPLLSKTNTPVSPFVLIWCHWWCRSQSIFRGDWEEKGSTLILALDQRCRRRLQCSILGRPLSLRWCLRWARLKANFLCMHGCSLRGWWQIRHWCIAILSITFGYSRPALLLIGIAPSTFRKPSLIPHDCRSASSQQSRRSWCGWFMR